MKKNMITVLMAGMMVITLTGCGVKVTRTEAAAETKEEVVTEMATQQVAEQPELVQVQVAEVQTDKAEVVAVKVAAPEEVVVEDVVEVDDFNEKLMEEYKDMLINYKDRLDRTQSNYGQLASQFRFADINGDDYPELFLLGNGSVITMMSYYKGDVWDAFDARMAGTEWIGSAGSVSFDVNGSKIKAYSNVGNRYEEYLVYEYVVEADGPALNVVKYTTTLNDSYRVGADSVHSQEVTRAEYEKFLDGMGNNYEVELTGGANDGYYTIDDAFDAYLVERGLANN